MTCYQLLEKPYRAEMVVRERMAAVKEPSPYMLTSLGDLTGVSICSCLLCFFELSNI